MLKLPGFVKKRDGSVVPFERDRIKQAILKALKATGEGGDEKAEAVTLLVLEEISRKFKDKVPHVEDIQDIVEVMLMTAGLYKTAKAYILYREKRRETRETEALVEESLRLVDDYLSQKDWRVRENSNMTFSLQGLNFHVSSSITARYWLNKIYPPEIARAHISGDIHIHDLGVLSPYCVGWDLYDLLKMGFRGVAGKIESRPPKHFGAALGQIVNFFYTLQGEAAGAQAFSNFDTLLAPFVRYDKLEYSEVKQALQEFIFNLNVPTRVGFQTPFTNLTLDITIPDSFKNVKVMWAGQEQEDTYGEFQEEVNMINKAFAELMMEGDARGRIFTFPIPTYNITKEFDWENPVLEPVFEMTAKYGIPYFANFVNSDMDPQDARSMCCRLRLDTRQIKERLFFSSQVPEKVKRSGGIFAANPLTGSIGVVTINLPRIAYLSRSEKEFFDRLSELMEIAKTSLEIKRKVIEHFTELGLYPYSKFYLREIKQKYGLYWSNHFSTIGLIGMHEATLNLLGLPLWENEARDFAIRVLRFMRSKVEEFQQETGNLYNLEATPAEGASYRLAKLDKEKFPEIITSGTDRAPYYTNSSQLPVNYTDDIFEALSHQEELQTIYTGGTVLHIFVGERITDPSVVKMLLRRIFENFRIPYITFTPTFSICPVHGYLPGEQKVCPYPHSDEDFAKYGVIVEMEEDEINKLMPGSYREVG